MEGRRAWRVKQRDGLMISVTSLQVDRCKESGVSGCKEVERV